jgi:predicted unusual protein kinase regulating ubiquinone biosynthesis (AarF/ABC1/UbiB family)
MSKPSKVPSSSLARLSVFAGITASFAGNVLKQGVKDVFSGRALIISDLILQEKSLRSLADGLSNLRGAAMKIGQLLSMDAGEFLPAELSDLLVKLQANATSMPTEQLYSVLANQFGNNWREKFSFFDAIPFASASIGQVHLAHAQDGTILAVKIQYKGIKSSIESDINNVARLLRYSRLLPKHLNLAPILEEAKKQLLDETNYIREAKLSQRYQDSLNKQNKYIVPNVYSDLSTDSILSTQFVQGQAIDKINNLDQSTKNNIIRQLIELFFEELFTYQLMQTDPNVANYLFSKSQKKLILLDFGATREIPLTLAMNYKNLIAAVMSNDNEQIILAATTIGFLQKNYHPTYCKHILALLEISCQPLRHNTDFDFANTSLAQQIKSISLSLNQFKDQWQQPPVDCMFIHRKIGGLYLLASKLNARVNCHQLFLAYAE